MKISKIRIASSGVIVSVLALAFLSLPEDSRAFGFDDEPPMEEIIVVGQRPPARDAQLNRMIAEMYEQAWMDDLQRQLNETHAELLDIEGRISDAEDSVEQSCRTIQGFVDNGTASCQEVAQYVHYVCLTAAGVLALETGLGGVAGAVACEASKDHQMAQCEANGGGITDDLMGQIQEYCPDVD